MMFDLMRGKKNGLEDTIMKEEATRRKTRAICIFKPEFVLVWT